MKQTSLFKPRVFHFSGGRSSGYMVLNNYKQGDLVIFCDTGREDEDTLRFVRDFEQFNSIPIIWLTGNFRKEVVEAEKLIPNRFKRKCTINLKIKKARRYLRSIGLFSYIQFIGFRYDEPLRVKGYKNYWQQVETFFPLHEQKISEPEILLYWKPIPYDLKIPSILKNCNCCFQKGESAVLAILSQYPEKADEWILDEESKFNSKGYTYFKGITFRQLRDKALSLTKSYDLEVINPKSSCSCTA